MYITYDELFNLPSMKKACLISGGQGRNRLISWFHLIELDDIFAWIEPNSIIFVCGVAFENTERSLLKIIKSVEQKEGAGLIIPFSSLIQEIPNSVLELSNRFNIPIIRIPEDVKMIEITYQIAEKIYANGAWEKSVAEFLKDVIYYKNRGGLEKRAAHFGYLNTKKYRALVIRLDGLEAFIDNNRKALVHNREIIGSCIKAFCEDYKIEPLFYEDNYSFILMLNNETSNKDLRQRLRKLQECIHKKNPLITVSVGIGKQFSELDEFSSSINDAQNALSIIHSCNGSSAVEFYDELGIYRILFLINDKEELRSIMCFILKKLCEGKSENNTELLKTLEMYFNCAENLKEASEKLFIHRNTLKYRLAKIEEILDCDLKDASTAFNLRLALYIRHYLHANQ